MSTWAREIGGYLKQIRSTHDDDSVDRLNYVTTIYLLLAFALTIFAKNYVGEPLQCWVPNQWKDPWEGFAESYCFVENTYFVPMNQTSLPEVDRRESMEMIYYQWVPFILSVMAFFFYLPRAIWRGMSSYSGLALSDMMSAARAAQKKFDEKKGRQLQLYVHTLEHKTQYVGSGALRYGRSLFNLYIVMKVLIFLNLMLQFYFLNHFLGTGYVLWGFGILIDLVNGRHWHESGHFPRVAFCDITVREMGNINNWTIQCVLQVNMFNEKIFIFIWWWLAFVLFLTTINFFYWIYCRFTTAARTTFVHKLREDSGIDEGNSEMEDRFYRDVLKDDGVLVLRLLDSNAGRLQSTALFSQLWHYKFKEGINSEVASDDGDDHTQLLKKKMADFVKFVQGKVHEKFDTTYDLDTTDRVKYMYSIWVLCAGSALFFARNYVGQPLQCWTPNQFGEGWESYAESYCFIESTYFVHDNKTNLPKEERRYDSALRWYQWVPVILAVEALILYSPRFLWKVLQNIQGISLSVVTVESRKSAKKEISNDFKPPVTPQKAKEAWNWGRRLTLTLLATKIISIALIIFQIFSLDWVIFGDVFYPFGLSVVVDALRGRQWQESGAFPRVTFCDFEVRELGQVHKWSLQCVLMINMYNEKVFVFIWWWLVFLLVISGVNLLKWIARLAATRQDFFIQRVVQCFTQEHWADVSRFRQKILKTDGVTLLHLIEENATIYQAADFIKPLWDEYIDKKD